MKECKNSCSIKCCSDPSYFFARNPGRTIKKIRECKVCEYWTSKEETACFCCGNKYHVNKQRKNHTIDQYPTIRHSYHHQKRQVPLLLLLPEITTK